jgi:hypothetical protein
MSFDYLYGFEASRDQHNPRYHELFLTRAEELARIRKQPLSDIIVIGGGICSLTLARLTSFHGLRTVVLAPHDIGVAPHSPLFRCEFSFQEQSELTRERCEYLRTHVPARTSRQRWGSAALQWLGIEVFNKEEQLSEVAVLSWQRYAIDLLLSARREGAAIISYTHLESFSSDDQGVLSVGFSDSMNGDRYEIRSGIIFNLTGRQNIGRIQSDNIDGKIDAFLRCDSKVDPQSCRQSFYLSRKQEKLALVDTRDGPVLSAILDLPLDADIEKINEIIHRWIESEGMERRPILIGDPDRTLSPLQVKSVLPELWMQSGHVLTLPAECLEYAEEVVRGGLLKAFQIANQSLQLVSLKNRPLSGTVGAHGRSLLTQQLEVHGLKLDQAQRLLQLYGQRTQEFLADPMLCEQVAGGVLKGELIHAKRVELATTSEDLLTRRLLSISLEKAARQRIEETFNKI